MFNFLNVFTQIGSYIWTAIRSLIAIICATLYEYIVDLYNVFMVIARADVLNNEYVQLIYRRVGMLLGLFMIFRLSFSLIQSLVNPDKFTDKKSGFSSIIVRCVVAIVLLGVTPTIFSMARSLQNVIVGADDTNNVLYRIIVADDIVTESNSTFGRRLSTNLFFSFFRPLNENYTEGTSFEDIGGETVIIVKDYNWLKEKCLNGEDDSGRKFTFRNLYYYMTLSRDGEYVFDWDIILSVGTAIIVLWIFINYCISIAVRTVQLAYLQLVAPIPILSYIGNPEGAFKKWLKQCSSTYLELFMRLGIIYFIVKLCSDILYLLDDFNFLQTNHLEKGTGTYTLFQVFIIIGLLMFGKRVPELLKDLFPGDGKFDFGIKSPKKLIGEIPGGNFAAGAAIGAVGATASNAIHGIVNTRKVWKDNKDKDGRVWKTLKAGTRGITSTAFGAFGGAKIGGVSGFRGKKIPGFAETVNKSNENREKRELKQAAGYHFYNVPPDKVLAFAGESTTAEKKIKEAERQQQALELSRTAMWKRAEDDVKNGLLSAENYSFIRGLEKTDKIDPRGGSIYRGFDSNGNDVEIFENNLATDPRTSGYDIEIKRNASIDSQIKKQKKIIKGLQTADKDAKK